MKPIRLLILPALWVSLLSCSSKTDPLPADTWSAGCIELAPYQGAYRLTGCCEYILLPAIKFDNRSFRTRGMYSTFNGAGFVESPVILTGKIAADGSTLTITYEVNSFSSTHTLKPGKLGAACFCGCD